MSIVIVQNAPDVQRYNDFFFHQDENGDYHVSRYAVDPYLNAEEKQREMEKIEKERNERKDREKDEKRS